MTPPIVEVTWLDACVRLSSKPLSRAHDIDFMERKTVGYLVKRNHKGKLVLAFTFDKQEDDDDEPSVDDRYVIPARWVQRVKVLRRRGR